MILRWLFLLLLATNILYLVWELGRGSEPERKIVTTRPGIETLVLVEEGRPGSSVEDESPTGTEVDEPEASETAQPIPEEPALVASKTPTPAASTREVPESAPEADRTAPVKVTQPAPAPAECYTIGPFRELPTLSVFTRAVKDYVDEVSFRSKEEREQSVYWVFIPPAEPKQVRAISKKLISKKIRDYYVIGEGDKKNGISLGHFKESERAYSHAKRLKALGFSAEVEPVFKTYTNYWVDYRERQGSQIPEKILKKHVKDNMKRFDRQCG